MFGSLSEKLGGIFTSMLGKKRLSEENISDAVREVRLALLEADVNYAVTKNFIKRVKEKALGDELLSSVTPGQQFTKILHDELAALMGGGEAKLELKGRPAVIMLCGLQGSGKTTQAAKLAHFLKGKKVAMAACDLARPAAVEQLKSLGQKIDVRVYAYEGETKPTKVVKEAMKQADRERVDVLILDTAGRLHIDDELMKELVAIKKVSKPCELLFVANAATGQDAVTTAKAFDEQLDITGSILTMLDGDTRGGAAISIREVTGKPLKFEGIGEKIEDLQLFNADSMADRILGMGDTINLVKKAKEHISEEEAASMEEKMRKASFTYEDYLKQIQAVRKMGSFSKIMKMMPGASQLPDFAEKEKEFFKVEAMILSMTPKERSEKDELSVARARRVAKGSGVQLSDVNKLKKSFKQAKQFFKGSNRKKLEKMMGGM
ncbi:MAG: Signal recognition particle protein [Chlamydiales bacterium]|nr:Signal recognition particle protein [Chlamydiales bacterium]MCH9634839.1 Signal recognition particle protein [Chlamydiales bacterium]MCH9703666.1 signal recognition particle protein [Chlamydiota bacterium]